MSDIKFAFRQLSKNPGFTAVAVLTLGLGIAANTAIFSFVNAILLRPLPFSKADELVEVYEAYAPSSAHRVAVAPPIFQEWRKQSTVFEGLAARLFRGFILTGRGEPEGLAAGEVSANVFSLLRVQPLFGRSFLPEEETYGKHHVALLSYELWERRFGGDRSIVGQKITLSDEPYAVVGVMPPRTFFPGRDTQIWTPLAFAPDEAADRNSHNYGVYGRLKPGFTIAQAVTELSLITRRLAQIGPETKGWAAEAQRLDDAMVGESKISLLALLASAGAVLLIACANIAGLMLARSAARSREFAIRTALGARRGQIVGQLLTESLLLAMLGALAGLLLASLALPVLIRISPPDLPRIWEGIHLDGWTLGFAMTISLLTGVAFGLVPALQLIHSTPSGELSKNNRGSSAGRQRQRARRALVVAEVAVSLVLLVGAGLMIRSFSRILSQPLGYNPEKLISFEVGLTEKKYEEPGAAARFFDALLTDIRAVRGMRSAALIAGLPLAHFEANVAVSVDGVPPRAPEEGTTAQYAQVSPGYFGVIGIPLLTGREFNESDRDTTTPVVIVNEAFIKEFKLGPDVLGRRLTLGDGAKQAEIVGVVRNVKSTDLTIPARSQMYRPYQQACWGQMRLIARTDRGWGETTRLVRAQLDSLDKNVPILDVRSMADLLQSSVAQRRLSTQLLGAFAVLALLLASIGLYGVIAYHVTQRTQEIGIRMALGAQRTNVAWLVLREGMMLTAIGITAGLIGSLALTRVLRRWLFEITPTDPSTFAGITLLLVTVAVLACWLPIRRAGEIEPMEALRHE
jgi:putative ABC transport system permease protein